MKEEFGIACETVVTRNVSDFGQLRVELLNPFDHEVL